MNEHWHFTGCFWIKNRKSQNIHKTNSNQNKLKQYNVKMYRQSDSKTGNILVTSDGSKIKIYNNVVGEDYKR